MLNPPPPPPPPQLEALISAQGMGSIRCGAALCFMLAGHLHIGAVTRGGPRAAAFAAGCAAAPLGGAGGGGGGAALRIVVVTQLSGAVSAQRLNKALKINHSSFLGANSHC